MSGEEEKLSTLTRMFDLPETKLRMSTYGTFFARDPEDQKRFQAERGRALRRLCFYLYALCAADIFVSAVLNALHAGTAVAKFERGEILQYTLQNSIFDLTLLTLVRVGVLLVLSIISVPVNYYPFIGWGCICCVALCMAKVIMFTAWWDVTKAIAVLMTPAFSFCEYYVLKDIAYSFAMSDEDYEQKRGRHTRATMRVLGAYFNPHGFWNKCRVILTWSLLALSKICNMSTPLLFGAAVQELSTGKIPWVMISLYVGLTLTSRVAAELQKIAYMSVKQQAFIQVAEMTFVHLHSLPFGWHINKKIGNVMRAADRGFYAADTIVSYLFLYLAPSLLECMVTFIIFAQHLQLHMLSALTFLSLCAYCAISIVLTLYRRKIKETQNKQDNKFHDKATDSLINYETVKYFTNEAYETQKFVKSVRGYQKANVAMQNSLVILNCSQQGIIQLTSWAGLLIAAMATTKGTMTVGSFVTVNMYILNFFQPLSWLGSLYNSIVTAFVDLENLSELLAQENDVQDTPNSITFSPPATGMSVEFSNVFFKYPKQPAEHGLQNISFKCPAGTTTAFVGRTGSGKTTISRLLFRFYNPEKGTIYVNGVDVKSYKQQSVRKHIGMVPQDCVLFHSTILHNIQYGNLDADFSLVERAAEMAQIKDFISHLPDGWSTLVGERGLKLSGGEKQRVALARCFLKDPPLLVLDEATSALDSKTEREVQECLKTLCNNRTTIVIAHRLSTVRNADNIIVLDKGHIVEMGRHQELIDLNGHYAQLVLQEEEERRRQQEAEEAGRDGEPGKP